MCKKTDIIKYINNKFKDTIKSSHHELTIYDIKNFINDNRMDLTQWSKYKLYYNGRNFKLKLSNTDSDKYIEVTFTGNSNYKYNILCYNGGENHCYLNISINDILKHLSNI